MMLKKEAMELEFTFSRTRSGVPSFLGPIPRMLSGAKFLISLRDGGPFPSRTEDAVDRPGSALMQSIPPAEHYWQGCLRYGAWLYRETFE